MVYTAANGGTPASALVWRPDGKRLKFVLTAGVWKPDADVWAKLQRIDDAGGALLGWRYEAQDARETESYDALGRLSEISQASGHKVSLVYNNGIIEANANDYLLTDVVAENGRSLQFDYDASRRITTMIAPDGAVYGYRYSAAGNLAGVDYPGGASRNYLYNEQAHTGGHYVPFGLTGILDEQGQRFATYTYDQDWRATSTQHGNGAGRVGVASRATGPTDLVLASGATERREYVLILGVRRAISAVLTADGTARTRTVAHDSSGRPDQATAIDGTLTDYDYNSRGLLQRQVESANQAATKRTTETDWHPSFRVPLERRVRDAAGVLVAKTLWTYNDRGQPLTETRVDPVSGASRTSTLAYCEEGAGCPRVGLLLSVDGPRSDVTDVTTYDYYAADGASHLKGDLWKVTNAAGHVTEYLAYDSAGRALSVRDANGVVTDLEYHPRGWLTRRIVRGPDAGTESDDAITQMTYLATGLVDRVTQPDGAYTDFDYDTAHRLTDITDNQGNRITYTLDDDGNRIQEDTRDAGNGLRRTLNRIYNQLGQLEILADANATPTDFVYDAAGNADTITDATGRITDQDHDPLGRLVRSIANVNGVGANRAESQFQYDAQDRVKAVIDPKGLTTSYTYNGFGDLTVLTSPDTGTASYGYDAAGNRVSQLDARGITSAYSYDALNRLIGVDVPTAGQDLVYTYDSVPTDCLSGETSSAGRLSQLTDASGTTRYCYDRRGNVVRKVQTVSGGPTRVVVNGYNAGDRLTTITYPSGAKLTYQRDSSGRISGILAKPTASAAQVTLVSSATYLPFGPLSSLTFGNGRVLTKAYDQNYGIDRVSDNGADGLDLDFGLDALGRVAGFDEKLVGSVPSTRSVGYDGQDRLTTLQNGATLVQGFTYDATGNRLSKTTGNTAAYVYPANSHRLSKAGNPARQYNASGSTTLIGTKGYDYSDHGRLVQTRNGTTIQRQYLHNGRGERVAKLVPSSPNSSRYFVYDEAGHLLGEYNTAGALVREYVWLDDTLVAVFGNHDGSNHQYVLTDHLGTPRAVVQPITNTVIWRWDLGTTAFGEHAPQNNPDGNTKNYGFDLRYPGQYYDSETGFHYNYFRDYEPGTGRYVQSDPIGLNGGASTYGYVGGNPLSYVDPSGLELVSANRRGVAWSSGPVGPLEGMPGTRMPTSPWRSMGGGMLSFVHPDPHSLLHVPPFLNEMGQQECVEIIKQGYPDTRLRNTSARYGWYRGPKVDENTPIGTAIASGWENGRYPSRADGNHGGYLTGWAPNEIRIIDQYPGKPNITERPLPTNLGPYANPSNDGGAMYVILWRE